MHTQMMPMDAHGKQHAVTLLKEGACVAMATETVYGLCANGLDENAVFGIFAAKNRPADNPLILHIAQKEDLSALVSNISPIAHQVIDAFWPGPLTLILPKAACVPYVVTAKLESVAVRLPQHEGMREIIQACGFPLAAPSANSSGKPSPTLAEHVMHDLGGRIPLILDDGPCKVGLESTVLDVRGSVARVLRPGGITVEQLQGVLGVVDIDPAVHAPLAQGQIVSSPGTKYKHYAPRARVTLVMGEESAIPLKLICLYDAAKQKGQMPAILCLGKTSIYGERLALTMSEDGVIDTAAANVFALLREMDTRGVEEIFIQTLSSTGIGLAIMNRLWRAANFNSVEA